MRSRSARFVVPVLLGLLVAVPIAAGKVGGQNGQQKLEVISSVAKRPLARTVAGTQEALPCTTATEPANFELYSLGPSFDGLPLKTVLRRCDNVGGANYVSYIYGDCNPVPPPGAAAGGTTDYGCAPPVEVQVWPACERDLASYGSDVRVKRTRRRSVPSATVLDWVEVYTADSTVVVFGSSRAAVEQAVSAVKPTPGDDVPTTVASTPTDTKPLPAPEPGALSGNLGCAS